jgi:sialate O-acetylesterase
VAYYFGRALQRDCRVPIGLIHTSWGGSPAEVWMREAVLAGNPIYQQDILDVYPSQERRYQEALAAYKTKKAEADKAGQRFNQRPPGMPWKPAELYNGMIAPLIPFAIRGAIWYQGEANAGRAEQYRTLFVEMISNWRDDWRQRLLAGAGVNQPNPFTFLLVQLAPWDKNRKRTLEQITETPGDSDWAELREAQFLATQKLPRVGMAVITDVGDKDDIHPTRKVPVGERLALAARRIAGGEKIVHSGPVFDQLRIKGQEAILSFKSIGHGLEARGGPLTGFSLCGSDRKFVWAQAEIRGNKIVVSHPSIAQPMAVRYGWSDYPVVNLWNKDGLPANPFRTDNFPLTTARKKS